MHTKNSSGNPTSEQQEKREQRVQKRAYDLYLKRGQEPGHELEDWLQAEQEIASHHHHLHPGVSWSTHK